METRFHSCVTILLLLEHTFGQSQLHGHFSFVGFVNFSPTKSIIGDQTIAKSQLKCSSNCFANDDCYFFDFCKTGSSSSCYLHNKEAANESVLESGECRRFGLVTIFDEFMYNTNVYRTINYQLLNYLFAFIKFGTATVAQCVRALAPQAKGWVFESQPRQTLVVKTGSDTAKRLATGISVMGPRRWPLWTDAPCHSGCGTLKNPHCSMTMSTEHRSKFAALHQ